jgi:hypothetical protein
MVTVLGSAGFLSPSYGRTVRAAMETWGATVAGGFAAAAARVPDTLAVIDDDGATTFGQLEARSNAVAHGLAAMGVRAGDAVGLLARNHAGFVEASIALAKVGANTLLLNTGFAGRRRQRIRRARPRFRAFGTRRRFSAHEFELLRSLLELAFRFEVFPQLERRRRVRAPCDEQANQKSPSSSSFDHDAGVDAVEVTLSRGIYARLFATSARTPWGARDRSTGTERNFAIPQRFQNLVFEGSLRQTQIRFALHPSERVMVFRFNGFPLTQIGP